MIQEKGVLHEKSRPENEVLIQFNESNINVDSYIGQYQINQIESTQDIVMTDTIAEQNIAIMTVQEKNPENISASGVIDESIIDAKITELKKDPRVKYVQKNFIYQINSLQKSTRSIQPTTFSGRSLPNDTVNFQNLWALDNQGQTVGDWNMVSGEVDADIDYPEAMAYASGKLNTKVVVAILDTGIEAHTDLIGNQILEQHLVDVSMDTIFMMMIKIQQTPIMKNMEVMLPEPSGRSRTMVLELSESVQMSLLCPFVFVVVDFLEDVLHQRLFEESILQNIMVQKSSI